MKVNDRGSIKWTSIMLPEHVEALKQLWEEQDYIKKPLLDVQQIEENSLLLQQAQLHQSDVRITYYTHNDRTLIEGSLIKIKNNIICINATVINFNDIINVEILPPTY